MPGKIVSYKYSGWKSKVERGKIYERSYDAGYAKAHMNVGAHAGVTASAAGFLETINTIDRPENAFAKGCYAGTTKKAVGWKNKSGERLPKAELSAAAGVGHARAEWSVFEAEAKGPNAAAGLKASVLGAEAFAKAELASASASAGPVKVKVGLAAETSVGVGLTGVEAKVLGTGISFGCKMGASLFGSEVSFSLW